MSSAVRHGQDEMFLERPSNGDSPTIEPLRIYKRESRSPEADNQPTNLPSAAFPLPPGASSSPASLPYPDDRQRIQQRPANPHKTTAEQGKASAAYPHSPPRAPHAEQVRTAIPDYPSALRPRAGQDGPGAQASSRLADRRGNAPKPLPESPGPEAPDKEGLFQRLPQREILQPSTENRKPSQAPVVNPYPDYYQQYWPPPGEDGPSAFSGLDVSPPGGVNRLSSTASTSTTKAQRGSPPPPETPIMPPSEHLGGGIEARYAAAGIAGTSTLTNLQAQSAAAAQRAAQYPQPAKVQQSVPRQQQDPPQRRWTPTEQPGSQPHGPPTVYQGPGEASGSPPVHSPTPLQGITSPSSQAGRTATASSALEQDFQRVHVTSSPPPAYTPAGPSATGTHTHTNEKHNQSTGAPAVGAAGAGASAAAAAMSSPAESANSGHPAFANHAGNPNATSMLPAQPGHQPTIQEPVKPSPAPAGQGPASPPPLPEGWIAHLDPNSGQYYYIHLPTQSTQWEFPKGPTPLNLNEPLSPTGSVNFANPLASPGLSAFSGKPLASPGFQPSTPGYQDSIMSIQSSTPTVAGFSGPPPSAGVDMYKIAPTNGVYFGPYLRYTNMDLERGIWLGSILLVTDALQPPTIHIHQSVDLSPNPRQLKASPISVHQRWTFYRYDIDLRMDEHASAKWTYAITSHLGCTRYEFLVAGRNETNWRFIATSGNDFSLNVNANERAKVGGIGYMWKDIMQKHVECGGFHTQLGLGDQIYADRIWKEIPLLKQWLAMSGKENRKTAQWTAKHEEDVSHAYFHYYTSHFDQPYLREAFAQIPYILQIDDHDM